MPSTSPVAVTGDLPKLLFIEQLSALIGKTETTIRTCATNAKYAAETTDAVPLGPVE